MAHGREVWCIRRTVTLLLYDFTIEYVGSRCLSRRINNHTKSEEDHVILKDFRFVVDQAVSCLQLSFNSVEQETQVDEQLRKACRYPSRRLVGRSEDQGAGDTAIPRKERSVVHCRKCIMFGERLVIPGDTLDAYE